MDDDDVNVDDVLEDRDYLIVSFGHAEKTERTQSRKRSPGEGPLEMEVWKVLICIVISCSLLYHRENALQLLVFFV